MKTMKQNFLRSKLAVIASLFFAFILLISCGLITRRANAETTFSADNFVMCEGAEVRTDGKNGIRFVASLGDALPTEEEYQNQVDLAEVLRMFAAILNKSTEFAEGDSKNG